MKTFKIWCLNKETKEGKKYTQYGIVREVGVEGTLPLVAFSDNCKKEMIKGDVELPTKNGHYLVFVDNERLITSKNGNETKPYCTIERLNKNGKIVKTLWFLGSIIGINKIEGEKKEDTSEDYALADVNEEDANIFGD